MLDMSWGEVLVIGAVALIVIGPKDLPKALRTVGKMTSQVRRMASEFQSQFNEAMREAELDEIKKTVSGLNESVSSFNPMATVRDELKTSIEGTTTAATTVPTTAVAIGETTPTTAPATMLDEAAAAAPLPGEPAFDLALPPAAPPVHVDPAPGPIHEPAPGPAAAESQKA
jgi:sec-independent protein translocase protein TatB